MISEKETKKKSVFSIILSSLWWCAVALLFLLLVSVFGAKISGKVPSVFGYSVMNIVSGSMEDEIPEGSYILIKKVSPEEVKRGDVICFYSSDPMIYGVPNTHRVVEEPIINDGNIEFVTKGDANVVKDGETAKGENLIGVYVKRLDGITAFSNALSGNLLIILFIGLQLCLIGMAAYSITVLKKTKNESENNSETSIDKK